MDTNFLLPSNMRKLGFELAEPSKDNIYFKYQNNATIHYNKDYNSKYPEPKGKVILYVNLDYDPKYPFIRIEQDGGTRTVYSGICDNEEFLKQLLYSVR